MRFKTTILKDLNEDKKANALKPFEREKKELIWKIFCIDLQHGFVYCQRERRMFKFLGVPYTGINKKEQCSVLAGFKALASSCSKWIIVNLYYQFFGIMHVFSAAYIWYFDVGPYICCTGYEYWTVRQMAGAVLEDFPIGSMFMAFMFAFISDAVTNG